MKYGEEIMAWIRMRPGAEPLTPDSLRAYCAGQLAHFKIPRYVHVVDEFPHDSRPGKVRKVEMRARAVEILGLDYSSARLIAAASRLAATGVADRLAHCRSRCHSALIRAATAPVAGTGTPVSSDRRLEARNQPRGRPGR